MVTIGKKYGFSSEFMNINYLVLCFNLLPIYPLDGFKTLKDVFLSFYEEEFTYFIFSKVSLIFNLIILIVLFINKKYFYLLIFVSLICKLKDFKEETTYSKLYKRLLLS